MSTAVRDTRDAALLEQFCALRSECIVGRVLILAAHPDDETIGAGGRLPGLSDVTIVSITDGAPSQDAHVPVQFGTRRGYAEARREERRRAMCLAGVADGRVHELGIPDQRASDDLIGLTAAVLEVLRTIRPNVLVTHPYEGGHPDHDAAAFAAAAALRLLGASGEPVPTALEMTSYHLGTDGIRTGSFLPHQDVRSADFVLDAAGRTRKRAMLDCFRSQREMLAHFRRDRERFRVAPAYAFSLPPHDGRLFYEHFAWGMSGAVWRARAREAAYALGLSENVA
jgi:LmbE family N-acetylglucosaminyl deacetylase